MENNIVEIKRIVSFCQFIKKKESEVENQNTSNILYTNFFEKMEKDFKNFEKNSKEFTKKELDIIKSQYFREYRSVFLENLFRKEIEVYDSTKSGKFGNSHHNIIQPNRVLFIGLCNVVVTMPKSMRLKIFKILAFIHMSYMNMKTIDSVLGYLISPKNINNVVLNNSKKENKEIVISKFSILHLSFERIIIKYTCINDDVKKNKIELLNKDGKIRYKPMFLQILSTTIFL